MDFETFESILSEVFVLPYRFSILFCHVWISTCYPSTQFKFTGLTQVLSVKTKMCIFHPHNVEKFLHTFSHLFIENLASHTLWKISQLANRTLLNLNNSRFQGAQKFPPPRLALSFSPWAHIHHSTMNTNFGLWIISFLMKAISFWFIRAILSW